MEFELEVEEVEEELEVRIACSYFEKQSVRILSRRTKLEWILEYGIAF